MAHLWSKTPLLPMLPSFLPYEGHPSYAATPEHTLSSRFAIPEDPVSPSSAATPPWARPLHLIDTDISIYKHDHGEDERENLLCLHCFKQHGSFNRILLHGYEVCGREEVLKSYYWE